MRKSDKMWLRCFFFFSTNSLMLRQLTPARTPHLTALFDSSSLASGPTVLLDLFLRAERQEHRILNISGNLDPFFIFFYFFAQESFFYNHIPRSCPRCGVDITYSVSLPRQHQYSGHPAYTHPRPSRVAGDGASSPICYRKTGSNLEAQHCANSIFLGHIFLPFYLLSRDPSGNKGLRQTRELKDVTISSHLLRLWFFILIPACFLVFLPNYLPPFFLTQNFTNPTHLIDQLT